MMNKMKKTICVLLAAIITAGALAGCQQGKNTNGGGKTASGYVSSEPFVPHKFGPDDLTVNGNIRLDMTVDEVKELLGEPDSEGTFTGEFIYGTHTELVYDGLHLTFFDVNGGDDFRLGIIYSQSEKDQFVGGLHVGCSADEVIADFTRDEEVLPLYFAPIEESAGDYLYGDINRNEFVERKPEGVLQFAYINRWYSEENGEYMLEYYYFNPLNWSDDGTMYTGDGYSMVFYVDNESGLVKGINLSYEVLE